MLEQLASNVHPDSFLAAFDCCAEREARVDSGAVMHLGRRELRRAVGIRPGMDDDEVCAAAVGFVDGPVERVVRMLGSVVPTTMRSVLWCRSVPGTSTSGDAQVRTRPRAVEPRGGASTNRAPCRADDHHVGPFGLVAENVECVPVHDVRFERHLGMASGDVSEDTAEIGLGVGAHRFDLKCEQRNLARRPDGEQHRHEDARDRVDLARRRCASSAAHRRGTEGCEPSNPTTSRSNMLTSSDAGLGPGQGSSPWV